MKTLVKMLLGLALACLLMLSAAPAMAGFTPKCRGGAEAEKPSKTAKTKSSKKHALAGSKSSSSKSDSDKKKSGDDDDDDDDDAHDDDDDDVYDDDDDVVSLFDVSER